MGADLTRRRLLMGLSASVVAPALLEQASSTKAIVAASDMSGAAAEPFARIMASNDGMDWTQVGVGRAEAGRSFVLPVSDSHRYFRLVFDGSNGEKS